MESAVNPTREIGLEIEVVVPIIGLGQNLDVQQLLAQVLTAQGIRSIARPYSHQPIPQGYELCVEHDVSLQDESRYAGIKWAKLDAEFVAVGITPAVVDAIRCKEGWPTRYREIEIAVEILSTGEVINAMTYIVTPEHRLSYDLPVSPAYRQLILDGAREFKFSQAYQKWLRVVLRPPANRPVAIA